MLALSSRDPTAAAQEPTRRETELDAYPCLDTLILMLPVRAGRTCRKVAAPCLLVAWSTRAMPTPRPSSRTLAPSMAFRLDRSLIETPTETVWPTRSVPETRAFRLKRAFSVVD